MSISVTVYLDDIYSQMNSWDKKEMVDYLRDDGYLNGEQININEGISITIPMDTTFDQEQHLKLCSKLGGLYYRISDEDIEIIRNIVNKY